MPTSSALDGAFFPRFGRAWKVTSQPWVAMSYGVANRSSPAHQSPIFEGSVPSAGDPQEPFRAVLNRNRPFGSAGSSGLPVLLLWGGPCGGASAGRAMGPTMKLPTKARPLRPARAPALAVPENLGRFAFWPVTRLSELVRSRHVMSTALTRMYLDRLKRSGPRLEGMVTSGAGRALFEWYGDSRGGALPARDRFPVRTRCPECPPPLRGTS